MDGYKQVLNPVKPVKVSAPFLLCGLTLLLGIFSAAGFAHAGEPLKNEKSAAPFTLTFTTSDYNGSGVSCNGASDGSIDMTISGGTSPFVILWSNGASSEDLSGIAAGVYTVTVTDFDLTVVVESVTITEPGVLSVSITSADDISCNGLNDGSIDITVSGGTPSYSYLWSNSSSSEDLTGLASGTYTVTVTDANNCTATNSASVGEPPLLTVVIDQTADISCNGLTDGSINITAAGGTGTITYNWSNGSSSEDLSGLAAGTYTVTVTDANNCTATSNAVINEPAALSVTASSTNATCNLSNGTLNALASGGTGTIDYLWSDGSTSSSVSGVASGHYTVTVTDDNGCTSTDTESLQATPPPVITVDSLTAVNCFGNNTGAAYISVSGGTLPYSIQWSNGQTSEDITSLNAGTYTVTVTDADLCVETETVVITQPAAALNDSITSLKSTCGLNNGSATVYPYGGTSPYSVLWSTGAATNSINSLAAGTYTVTITDANQCTRSSSVTVIGQPGPAIIVDSVVSVKCFGGNSGAIYISITGGTAPITYLWSNGSNAQDLLNRTTGTYTVTVTDANSCTATTSQFISQPSSVVNDSIVSTSSFCGNNNGTATVYPYGGTAPYTVLWSNGATSNTITGLAPGTYTVTVTDANQCTEQSSRNINNVPGPVAVIDSIRNVRCFGQTNGGVFISAPGGVSPKTYLWSNGAVSQDINNVASGTYTVTVTDNNGCTSTVSGTVNQPSAALSQNSVVTPTGCAVNNGSIEVTPAGGTSPYTYLWSNGATGSLNSGLGVGTYTVTITDANNCTLQASASVTTTPVPTVTVDSVDNISCFGENSGAIYITAASGTSPYSYLWSNSSTSQDLTSVTGGTYTVTVTDANSCTASVSQVISQPATALNDSINSVNSICSLNGGSATVFPYGGTSPYSLLWSTGSTSSTISSLSPATYTVTITDANQCTRSSQVTITGFPGPEISADSVVDVSCFGSANGGIYISVTGGTGSLTYQWSNGTSSQDLINVGPGTYTVTVTDDNGCTDSFSASISQPSAALSNTIQVTSTACTSSTGTAQVFPSGGTTPYSYQWSNGGTSAQITNLAAGNYTVTVTDDRGCTTSGVASIFTASSPAVVVDSIRTVRCFNGSTGAVYITASGGTQPYSYLWSTFVSTEDLLNVAAGTYTVSVTDANGCTALVSAVVTQPAAALNDSVQIVQATCGNNNGSVTVFPFNGTSPYTFQWNNGATTQTISGLSPGSYTVTVTDNNACTRQRSVSIINIAGPTLVLDSIRNVSCFGATTGAIFITSPGGTSPKTYSWSNGTSSQDLTGVAAGTYTVTVTDANNCTATLTAQINQPATGLNDSLQVFNASCGAPTGSITVYPYGGTSPYTYLWSNGQTSQTIFNLNTGTYTVTITDAAGCTRIDSASITNSGAPVVGIDSIVPVKCFGQANGGIYISVSGGAGIYDYQWSNGAQVQDLTNVATGSYTVTVTDINNCVAIISGFVPQPTQLTAVLTNIDATCGLQNGSVTANPSGGTPTYTYLWNNSQITATINAVPQGIYTVTITDLNGCTIVRSDTVNNSDGPLAVIDSVVNVNCFGQSTGGVFISVTGGATPNTYQWSNGTSSQNLTGVPAGTYTVTVTDQNACTVSLTAQVTESTEITLTSQVTNATCNSPGSIAITASGGSGTYSYEWNTGATTSTVNGLNGGGYTITVTDGLSCSVTQSFTVIASSTPVITTDSIVDVKCNGQSTGAAYITISNGSFPYSYAWSNGAATEDLTGVPAGNYSIIVTDFYSCKDTLFLSISEPTAIQDSLNNNPANCNLNNGSAKIYPYGGTPPYTYQWSSGCTSQTCINMAPGLHTVTVTDANQCQIVRTTVIGQIPIHFVTTDSTFNTSCNGGNTGAIYISVGSGAPPYTYQWSNGASSQNITGLAAGTYTVTVTDSVNCSINQVFNITEPDSISDNATVVNATCGFSNGSVSLSAAGGTGTLSYQWSTGAVTSSVTGLAPGTITVTVTDQNSCSNEFVYVIDNIPGPVVTLTEIQDVTCFGGDNGSIEINITAGTSPFTFEWSNGATTQNISGIPAGNYCVTVTDSNNCEVVECYTVTEAAEITATADITDVACGSTNGSITVFPVGGTGAYAYLWNNSQSTQTINNLAAGIYTVTVTDDSLCSEVFQFTVTDVGSPNITVDSLVQVTCSGDSSGAIYLGITGNSPPFTYVWSNGSVSPDLIDIPAGSYTVTVSDVNNCTATITQVITEPPAIQSSFNVSPANCNTANGEIEATASGGTGNLSYLWSNGFTTTTISNLAAGIYTLTITDQAGCTKSFDVPVPNLSAPVITVTDSVNVTCAGAQNGSITVSVSGGQLPYAYSWTNTNQTTPQITGLAGNITYTLTVTDNLGCVAIRPVFISEPSPIVINAVIPQRNDTFNLTCNGSNDGTIKLVVSGGISPYSYLWSNLALTDSIGNLAAGNYAVTVTDQNGCTAVRNFTLTQPPLLVSNAGQNNIICGINSDTLDAAVPAFGTGYWTIVSGFGVLQDSTLNNTIVTDLSNGVNVFQWVVTDGICSAVSQVVITYNTQIFAIPGVNRTICADTVLLTATTPQFGYGYWEVVNSDGTIQDTSKAVTLVTGLNQGANVFRWVVINGTCSDSAEVVIFRQDPELCIEEIEFPTGFTPNDDNRNDLFIIKGIKDYPENTLVIYNRWGNKVYEKSNYANDWNGVNDSGELLPEGTYFYIFKVRKGARTFTGYIDLRR